MLVIKNLKIKFNFNFDYIYNNIYIKLDKNDLYYEDKLNIIIVVNYRYGDICYDVLCSNFTNDDLYKNFFGDYSIVKINKITEEITTISNYIGSTQIYYRNIENIFIVTTYMYYFKIMDIDLKTNWIYFYDYILSSFTYNRFELVRNTPFIDIYRVPFGSILTYNSLRLNIVQWWDIFNIGSKLSKTLNNEMKLLNYFDEIFTNICNEIIKSNKNILLLLSSGLDSNTLLFKLSQLGYSNRIIAITFTTTNDYRDEKWEAEKNAKIACVKKWICVDIELEYEKYENFKNNIYSKYYNEPSIQHTQYKKIKILNEYVKLYDCSCIIDGDGGDHLFSLKNGFINDYKFNRNYLKLLFTILSWQDRYNKPIIQLSKSVEDILYRKEIAPNWIRPSRTLINILDMRKENYDIYYTDLIKQKHVNKMQFLNGIFKSVHTYSDITHWENCTYFSPYFDRRLTEFIYKVPCEYLWKYGENKLFLKKYAKKVMPDSILSQTYKKNNPEEFYLLINEQKEIFFKRFKTLNDEVKNKLIITNLEKTYNQLLKGDNIHQNNYDAINRMLVFDDYITKYLD